MPIRIDVSHRFMPAGTPVNAELFYDSGFRQSEVQDRLVLACVPGGRAASATSAQIPPRFVSSLT
jgi:hypothetical protein